jgi:hypothetical protein
LTAAAASANGLAMTLSLPALRLRARALALVAALLYLLPLLAPVLPAPASAEDAAFAEAVRAGVICTTPEAASPPQGQQAPVQNHAADHCSACITGCASGAAAPPQAVALIAHPRLVGLPAAPRADRADPPGFGRPASDVAARAPPARALA